jgi:hypothetical protein
MVKLQKIAINSLGIFFECLLICIIIFAFLIRTSTFQTFLAGKFVAFLSKELNTKIELKGLEIILFDKVSLNGILILDKKKDTLLFAESILLTIDDFDLSSNSFDINKIELSKGSIYLNRNKKNGAFNYAFLVDYFSGDTQKTKSKKLSLTTKNISLSDFLFRFDDFRVKPGKYGIDFAHLYLRNIGVNIQNLALQGETIKLQIQDLKCIDKSGFNLEKLSAGLRIGSQGIFLKKFQLISNETNLRASKLNLLYRNWSAFSSFSDSVIFDVEINPSTLSMKDVSYFATDLEGMDSKIRISASLKNPISSLAINNLDLRFGNKSFISGKIVLPNFSIGDQGVLNARIVKSFVTLKDIQSVALPKSMEPFKIDPAISKLVFFKATNASVAGKMNRFNFGLEELETALGSISLKSNYLIENNDLGLLFSPLKSDTLSIDLTDFNLGALINNSDLGLTTGLIQIEGSISNSGQLNLPIIRGLFSKFQFNDYSYSNIEIEQASLLNEILKAKLEISDPNINLTYQGEISLGKAQKYIGDMHLENLNLGALNFTKDNNIYLSTDVSFTTSGPSLELISGQINFNGLSYKEAEKELIVPNFNANFSRSLEGDYFQINSSLVNAKINGEINYETVLNDLLDELSILVPSLNLVSDKPKDSKKGSDFSFEIETKDLDPLFFIFAPELNINSGSLLKGYFNSKIGSIKVNFSSDFLRYNDFILEEINLNQAISNREIQGDFLVNTLSVSDSLKFNKVHFVNSGSKGMLNSTLTWDPESPAFSQITWRTSFMENDQINFLLKPSFFSLNGLRWQIENESDISLTPLDLNVTNFKLIRNEQQIKINGCLSKNDFDKLKIDVNQLDLTELSSVLGLPKKLGGFFSGWGMIANPYSNFTYLGDATFQDFLVDGQEVGDILIQTDWSDLRKSILASGLLEYRNQPTLDFGGAYFINTNQLDLRLKFNDTDIQFANSFLDPTVAKDLNGKIKGVLTVKGTPDKPKLSGKLSVDKGSVKVELLGVKYRFNGKIDVVEDGFLINNLPLKDEDGNIASMVGTIYHKDFSGFNFDLNLNFEDDLSKRDVLNPLKVLPLDQFMVLNTNYKDGDVYFGKAYAKGTANISGTSNKLDVLVELETKKGTLINFPMYGVSDIEESEDFIQFVQKGINNAVVEDKINFSGVNLDLKFKVTPESNIKLIFDEFSGDEITAKGFGEINMKLDQLDHLTMNGTYNIVKGSKYNFVMMGINQPFNINEGSSISWNGDVLDANLDIKTSIDLKKISILELSPETADKSLLNQDVLCYLNLSDKLLKPTITFDIAAPKAPETGKALIRRVTNEQDELNRQFFSLLLVRKFQPLKGTVSASGSSAIDLVESQINAALGKLSESYKLNVDYGADKVAGDNSVELGVKTGLLNDRLIVSGSFGVENKTDNASGPSNNTTQSSLIGDVNIEYLINEKGTFRVNVFNQSNANSVNENSGPFTQGAGISYHEEFNTWKDFQLFQAILDVFRKKDKKHFKKIKVKKKLPALEVFLQPNEIE